MKHLNNIILYSLPIFVTVSFILFNSCQDQSDELVDTGDVYVQDTDGDTIIDPHEGEEDVDGDGIPNYKDEDSDGDCIPDRIEAGDDDPLTYPVDSDADGTPDYIDTDSDNNGIPDSKEVGSNCNVPLDTDGDSSPDFSDEDNDGDQISDETEIGNNPNAPIDSDEDTIPDYLDQDSDGDSIPDMIETDVDTDGDGSPDYLDLDSDSDGLMDTDEAGANPTNPLDTDNDNIYDFQDSDSDGDSIPDSSEVAGGTDWLDRDSDDDGYSDGVEIYAGSDPLNSSSTPDGVVITLESRSTAEYLINFTLNSQLMDIMIILDISHHYSCFFPDPDQWGTSLVPAMAAAFPDANFGVGYYDDYQVSGWAYSGLSPFRLVQQLTSDLTAVATAFNSLNSYYSYSTDAPGTTLEALYQVATGVGFDEDCDDNFDNPDDILPFIANPSDAFGGTVSGSYDPTTPDSGTGGGAGFRDGALPIIIYTANGDFRDPDDGDAVPNTCCNAVGESETVDALNTLGAKLIGINAYEYTSTSLTQEITQLAIETGSYWDEDGDGAADDPIAIVSGWQYPSASTIINAINALTRDLIYDISVEVEDDPYGFVTSINPTEIPDVPDGTTVTFTITVTGTVGASTDDTIYAVTLNIVGNGTTILDTVTLYIVISGS